MRTPYEFKVENYRDGLSKEYMKRRIPAVFGEHRNLETTSEQYQFIDSETVLDALLAEDFVPVLAMQQRAKTKEGLEFTKHAITYRERRLLGSQQPNIPQFHVVNDHRGGAAFIARSAVFTLICQNGLIIASQDFAAIRVVHKGDIANNLVEAVCRLAQAGSRVLGKLEAMKQVVLSPEQRLTLAQQAHSLRFGDKETSVSKAVTPEALLNARWARWYRVSYEAKREEEALRETLYGTFQQLQEAGTKGVTAYGVQVRPRHIGRISSKQMNSIDSLVDFNTGLWQAAENYLN